jgi:hypothetical protein
LKRFLLLGLLAAAGIAVVSGYAQDGTDKPYQPDWDKVKTDITAQAETILIEPRFKGVAGDYFEYEIDVNTLRTGTTRRADTITDAFRRTENWGSAITLKLEESELEGRKDLRLALRYDRMNFLIDNGRARYAGYIGPEAGGAKPAFHEILPDGTRQEVTNIPGWPGINARTINTQRETQARETAGNGSAWASISETSRLHGETYFADYGSTDQRNYPGRFQDPLHLMLGLLPEFGAGAGLKIGDTMKVTRRMPVGASHGATTDYTVTYKLEKVYGTTEEPAAAKFSFEGVPAKREHTATADGLTVAFTAPDIREGTMLLDLTKGVPLYTKWSYSMKGSVRGDDSAAEFEVEVEFTASLRADRATEAE